MRAGRKLLVLGAILALVATACVREGPIAPREIIAKDYSFQGMPERIQGGTVSVDFENQGKAIHELAFLNIGNLTLDQFKTSFPAVFEGKPIPWLKTVAVPITEVAPGDRGERTFTLPAGRYLLMCASQDKPGPADDESEDPKALPHYSLGMAQFVTVEGSGADVPDGPDGTITAKDYSFDVPELKAGENRLAFQNIGPKQFHFGELMEFGPGVTPAQAVAAFKKSASAPEGAPPPPGVPQPEEAGFSGAFSPGLGGTWNVTLDSGRTYFLACFFSDREGGPPHAIKYGMYKAFTVKAK